MLQIASGKFFRPVEMYETLHRRVMYTNYQTFGRKELTTSIAKLLPSTDFWPGTSAMTCEIIERQEKIAKDGSISAFMSTLGHELMEDYAAVLSFALNATFTLDIELTRKLTTGNSARHPQKHIDRLFDFQVCAAEGAAEKLTQFVGDLTALDRRTFEGAMKAIRRFVLGAHRIAEDSSLAYSLFVMSIESLSQGFDGHQATWKDYDAAKRNRINSALKGAPEKIVEDVRAAILEHEHVALARRFREFATAHLRPSYFREEAVGAVRPLGVLDLDYALRQAYKYRSEYVHRLQDIPSILVAAHDKSELAWVDGQDVLTFQGIMRLSRHIILEFIKRGTRTDKEVFEYRSVIPGIVSVPMAAQYWIGSPTGFNKESAKSRLSGLLEQIQSIFLGVPNATMTDLTEVMAEIEKQIASLGNPKHRLPMLTIYYLFNRLAPASAKRPNWFNLVKKYDEDFRGPSIESLVACFATEVTPPWDILETSDLLNAYIEQRNQKNGFKMGSLFEAALMLHLAELYRSSGDEIATRWMISRVVEAHPNNSALQFYEKSITGVPIPEPIIWSTILLPATTSNPNDDKAKKVSSPAQNESIAYAGLSMDGSSSQI